MRLFHIDLIKSLPYNLLEEQHIICSSLRGLNWGIDGAGFDYIFKYPYCFLVSYHITIITEMKKRGLRIDHKWYTPSYRGRNIGYDDSDFTKMKGTMHRYKEHDENYYNECIVDLKRKGIVI
jgi:uncharacterized protein (TIGR02328 family)